MKKHIRMLTAIAVMAISTCFTTTASAIEPRKNLGYKWANAPCTVSVYTSLTGTQKTAVQAAINSWNNVKNAYDSSKSMVTFQLTSTNSPSTPSIVYEDIASKWVGYCYPDILGDNILGFEIDLNSGYEFTVGKANGKFDIQSVVAHELGHALGVAHCHESANENSVIMGTYASDCFSSTCAKNVMTPYVSPNALKRTLQTYDSSSYQYIYS